VRRALLPPSGRIRVTAAAVTLAVLLVLVGVTLHAGVPNQAKWRLLVLIGACWAGFALAAAALLRTPPRAAVRLLLLGAMALQAVALTAGPQLTDDYFRYAWDGRVQAAGIDPYRYPPVDPALAPLRDAWLFPPSCRDAVPVPCTRLNHPTSPTIYPPVAQAWFRLVHELTAPLGPDGGGAPSLQVAAALLALAGTGALLLVLRRHGDPRRAVLWAWCPTVVLEAGNNAHVDVLAAVLVIGAMGLAVARRPVGAGLVIGAAIAAKLLPVLALPALLAPLRRRTSWRTGADVAAAAAVATAASYLPHLLAVGTGVLGFLPEYLHEEGYGGRVRFALLRPWLPEQAAAVAGPLLVVVVAAVVAWRGDRRRPWHGAAAVVAVALTVGGIAYPWYGMLLVALVALGARAELLAVVAASYPGYFTAALHLRYADTQRAGYGAALAVVLVAAWWRRRRRRADRSPAPTVQPSGGGPIRPSTDSAAVAS
jgi:hypothetical protein